MRTHGSPEALERQRFRAIALLQAGHRPLLVARMLGVSPGSVSQWKKRYEHGGFEALKAKLHPGPPPKLTARQGDHLARLLLQGPQKHGYANALWTLPRIAAVIRRQFGVTYDPSGVWHVLHRMGWSCQKPERRARERDEDALAACRTAAWPRIKKRPKKR
jgi:transposase